MISILTTVAIWCAPFTNVQMCREQVMKCITTYHPEIGLNEEVAAITCFLNVKVK
jgi:hypothetical protein